MLFSVSEIALGAYSRCLVSHDQSVKFCAPTRFKNSNKKNTRRSRSTSKPRRRRQMNTGAVYLPRRARTDKAQIYSKPIGPTQPRRRPTGIAKAAGGAIAGALGIPPVVGEVFGDIAAKGLTTVLDGSGDYAELPLSTPINTNTLLGVATPEASQIPSMHRSKGCTRISHREFFTDVAMTTAFTCRSYTVSPVSQSFLPWLATVARGFQEYRIMGLVVEFRSLAANAISGTNAGMGSITAAFNYDVYSIPPASKIQLSNQLFAVSCKPSENMMIPMECEPDEDVTKLLHISQGQNNLERHFYDFARLDVVTQGASAGYAGAGELWVTYDIMLFKPILTQINNSPLFHYQLEGATSTVPWEPDTGFVQPAFNNMGAVVTVGTSLVEFSPSIPVGWYGIMYALAGTATTSLGVPVLTLQGGFVEYQVIDGVQYKPFQGYQSNFYNAPSGANTTCTQIVLIHYVYYDGTGTTATPPGFDFFSGTFPASNHGDVMVWQVNSGLISTSSLLAAPTPMAVPFRRRSPARRPLHYEEKRSHSSSR